MTSLLFFFRVKTNGSYNFQGHDEVFTRDSEDKTIMELPLEQLLTGYQRGATLLGFCRQRLDAVEDQIKVLDEGTLKPWTPE